jgi:lipid-A-disaccharide synthase
MQGEGMTSLFPMHELSIMGLLEVLPRYFHLKRRIRETAQAVLASGADGLVTIDSPDFCLRVAKLVKRARPDLKIIHYVAPSVWAWRPGRATKMAAHVDHVLALLPFEPPYMEAAGMGCDFVGHPVVAEPLPSPTEIAAIRADLGLPFDVPLVVALPGSRRGELARLGGVFGASLRHVTERHSRARVIVPTVAPLVESVKEVVRGWPGRPHVLDPRGMDPHRANARKRAAMAAANVALAASGTVSLELAAARTPMVIAYDMNKLTRRIISGMLKIDTVTLVNLVSETRSVPEFINENCRADRIGPALLDVMDNPLEQADAMAVTMDRLGEGGLAPGLRAADAVLRVTGLDPFRV